MKTIKQIQDEIASLRQLETQLRNGVAKGIVTTITLARYQAKIEVLEWVLTEMP